MDEVWLFPRISPILRSDDWYCAIYSKLIRGNCVFLACDVTIEWWLAFDELTSTVSNHFLTPYPLCNTHSHTLTHTHIYKTVFWKHTHLHTLINATLFAKNSVTLCLKQHKAQIYMAKYGMLQHENSIVFRWDREMLWLIHSLTPLAEYDAAQFLYTPLCLVRLVLFHLKFD